MIDLTVCFKVSFDFLHFFGIFTHIPSFEKRQKHKFTLKKTKNEKAQNVLVFILPAEEFSVHLIHSLFYVPK